MDVFNLEDVHVERRDLQISSAFLRVSGDVLAVDVGTCTQPRGGFISIRSPMGATIGLLYPDIASDVITPECLFFLRIRQEPGGSACRIASGAFPEMRQAGFTSEPMCMGLALRSQAGSEGCYERVGLIRCMREASMGAGAVRSVVIY